MVMNTVGNVFRAGGRRDRQDPCPNVSVNLCRSGRASPLNREDKSTSINTQMESLIPASKISHAHAGHVRRAVADNFSERIEQKIFHCEIVVDAEKGQA